MAKEQNHSSEEEVKPLRSWSYPYEGSVEQAIDNYTRNPSPETERIYRERLEQATQGYIEQFRKKFDYKLN